MTHRTVDEHAAHIRDLLDGLGAQLTTEAETVPLAAALGRVSAAAVPSPVDLPLFRNSQMDGFAVHVADIATIPAALPIVGEIAARPISPAALAPGTVVRIMTGAVVPEGADAVVPVEDTTTDAETVTVNRSRSVGEYVRERGSDIAAGTTLVPAGIRLGPRHLAALAAAGVSDVLVQRRVHIAVITTGAELIGAAEVPTLGQVYDANSVALIAAIESAGAVVSLAARVTDRVDAMLDALAAAAAVSDVIVTSGGISMGDYEVVREALEPLGASVGHVAMQPGGPQATAHFDGVPVLCFPGNPVSTQLSFEVFLAPVLRELAALPAARRESLSLAGSVTSVPGKRQFLRARRLPDGRVATVSGPGSHLVAGLAASDLLIDVPTDTLTIDEGDTVETWQL
jgi:molybdopterin molybdotransferase